MTTLRKLPAVEPRIETGATQCGDDWPGVFIRGDNAYNFAFAVRQLLEHDRASPITRSVVRSLVALLESCNVRNLEQEN